MLVDNGRSAMLGTEFQDMLRCIRCAACMNHCPVYGAVGGHAYGWIYPGPMGSGADAGADRGRSGRAAAQCQHLLRQMRERVPGENPAAGADAALARTRVRAPSDAGGHAAQLALWAWFARRPGLYGCATRAAGARARAGWAARRGRSHACLAGGWTEGRDFPAPEGETFFARYAAPSGSATGADPDPMSRAAILGAIRRGLRRGALPEDRRRYCAGGWRHIRGI